MKRHMPVTELARDERFEKMRIEDLIFDPRNAVALDENRRSGGFKADQLRGPRRGPQPDARHLRR